MHGIVVLSTCCDEMHDIILYDDVSSSVHNVSVGDFMMNVLLYVN